MELKFFTVSENQYHDSQHRGAILRPEKKRWEKNEHKKKLMYSE